MNIYITINQQISYPIVYSLTLNLIQTIIKQLQEADSQYRIRPHMKHQQVISSSSEEEIGLATQTEQQIAQLNKIPKFMAFNQHITYGYRLGYKQPWQIVRSLFVMHNQTINIWTHLIGAVVIVAFIVCFFTMVDKAQLQYQLKRYEQTLNKQFKTFTSILHRVQTTLSTFQHSQQSHLIPFSQLQYQLRSQYTQVLSSVKLGIAQIHRILLLEINLNEDEKRLRVEIAHELLGFERIERQFEKDISIVLWAETGDERVFNVLGEIQLLRGEIERVSQQINRKVIQYLQLQKQTPNPYGIPRWPIIIFLFTATLCLGFSAIFHLFYPMSSRAFKYFRRFDYAGVILNIVGTGIPPIYYALYCKPFIATIYLAVMIVFGCGLFIILLQDWIHKARNKRYKPILFGMFGLTYLVPYSHFMITEIFFDNFGDTFKFSHSNFWWFMCAFSFLFGLYIFIKKWPESKYKHKFDLIGSSHQIWHFLCLCGVASTYFAININYQTRKQCPCPL